MLVSESVNHIVSYPICNPQTCQGWSLAEYMKMNIDKGKGLWDMVRSGNGQLLGLIFTKCWIPNIYIYIYIGGMKEQSNSHKFSKYWTSNI